MTFMMTIHDRPKNIILTETVMEGLEPRHIHDGLNFHKQYNALLKFKGVVDEFNIFLINDA